MTVIYCQLLTWQWYVRILITWAINFSRRATNNLRRWTKKEIQQTRFKTNMIPQHIARSSRECPVLRFLLYILDVVWKCLIPFTFLLSRCDVESTKKDLIFLFIYFCVQTRYRLMFVIEEKPVKLKKMKWWN
jgi:hypothetical protein